MFDGEEFGAEIVSAVKSHIAAAILPMQTELERLKTELETLAERQPERGEQGPPGDSGVGLAGAFIDREGQLVVTFTDGTVGPLGAVVGSNGSDGKDACLDAPDDIIDDITKAIALAAQSSQQADDAQTHPIVVNISQPNSPKKSKIITAHKDENGNLVANITEQDAD